jgi:aspartyl-tRNA(Asn)/glutamyl-tRNA(Gln) amidotransferase subunit B
MEPKVIIGLECHLPINRVKSKLFCGCSLPKEDSEPNTHCCPTCIALPGSKPVTNKKVIECALKLGLALNCAISDKLIFSRKIYFYDDLPKNFQITQYEIPLGKEGHIILASGKKIRLTRVHVEEDPGALIHKENYCLVDYNRSGIPLVEVVSEPDLSSPEEAREFMNKLLGTVSYLGIYDSRTGVIKADANINIEGYERVEIKNITGFKEIERALIYEVERQKKLIEEGKGVKVRETRGWDSEKGITFFQRSKEEETDYGYIIETDLVPIEITKKWVNEVRRDIPELAHERTERYIKKYKLKRDDAEAIAAEFLLSELYDRVAVEIDPVLAAKWMRRELMRVVHYNKLDLHDLEMDETHLVKLLGLIENGKITAQVGQRLMEKLIEKPFDVEEYVKKENLESLSEKKEIEKYCRKVIEENKKAVEDYKNGEEKALNFLVGKVMMLTKGKATPKEVNGILRGLVK